MQTDKNIQQKIDAAIGSVNNLQRATPSPFFYTRLIGRLDNQRQTFWEKISLLITRPAVAFACMCLIVLINVVAIYSNTEAISNADQTEVAVTDDFTQSAPSFYDIENVKP